MFKFQFRENHDSSSLRSMIRLAYEDAFNIDGLDEVAEQSSLVSQHLPLSKLVRGGHADYLGGRVIKG